MIEFLLTVAVVLLIAWVMRIFGSAVAIMLLILAIAHILWWNAF